jgi:DNA invertase Pin-like site-specific DNA recombinase
MGDRVTRAALYIRVSTDDQTVENQRQALQVVAERRGWHVTAIYRDEGISGSKTRQSRPGLDQMLNDAQRRKFDVVAAWSIDRLGRSLADLLDTLSHLKACGVALYVDRQNVDTTTPIGEAMFQMVGVFAQFERALIRERVKAGMARAVSAGKRIGRPTTDAALLDSAKAELAKGTGILKTARMVGIGVGTVQKLKKEMQGQVRGYGTV